MLKKDINKLLRVKREIEKFTGDYETSNGHTIKKKTKYIVSSLDCKNIITAYNELCTCGHTETMFNAVANIFRAFNFNVNIDSNNIYYSISL